MTQIGPVFPGPADASTSSSIGPSLPASIGPTIPDSAPAAGEAGDDSDSDSDYGPALPPDLVQERKATVLGPQLPPGLASSNTQQKRETPLSALYSDDDEDDDYVGPVPLPQGVTLDNDDGVMDFLEREKRARERAEEEARDKGPVKREEWMLVPPKEMDMLRSTDPTKLKARGFQQNTKVAQSKSGPSNLWTETPQERQKRMEDEVLGKRKKAEIGASGADEEGDDSVERRRKRARDQQLREEVERLNKSGRSESLLDQHKKGKGSSSKKDKDEGPPGIWERDRDMALGGRLMAEDQKRDLIKNARELGGRFGGGSYL